jgi:hypothetical protein
MKKKHTLAGAISSLSRKGVEFNETKKLIMVPKNHSLGNGSWGRVDFLVSQLKYKVVYLT